ncbi:MAG: hypothetical protein CMC55_04105 [Flavobacteriaceae bacterium]|nr:hypothetical protein [Flavobacteriaceae bacterium]
MVSQELAQQMRKTSEAKEQVRLREEEFKKVGIKLEAQKFQLTRQQRQQLTRQQRRLAQQKFQVKKSKALSEFRKQRQEFQLEVAPIKKSIAESSVSIDRQIAYGYGRKIARRSSFDFNMGKYAREGFRYETSVLGGYKNILLRFKEPQVEFRIPREVYREMKKEYGEKIPISAYKKYYPEGYSLLSTAPLKANEDKKYKYDPDYRAWLEKKQKKGGEFFFEVKGQGPTQRYNMFKGKKNSPYPLQKVLIPMPSELVSMGGVSSILPTTEAVPHMESSGSKKLFGGNIRNPQTWLNQDPTTKFAKVIDPVLEKFIVKPIRELKSFGKKMTKFEIKAEEYVRRKLKMPTIIEAEKRRREEVEEFLKRGKLEPLDPTQERGTLIFKQPKQYTATEIIERYPKVGVEVLAEKRAKLIQRELDIIGAREASKLEESKFLKDLQKEVSKDILTESQAQELYEKEFERKMAPYVIEKRYLFQEYGKELSKKAIIPQLAKDALKILPTAFVLGGFARAVPLAGKAIGGYFGLRFITLSKVQKKLMLETPARTGAYIGLWAVGGMAGAGVVKGLGIKSIRPFTAKVYPNLKPKPIQILKSFKGGKKITIIKKYPAWYGQRDIPIMRSIRKIPLLKKVISKPKKILLKRKTIFETKFELTSIGKEKKGYIPVKGVAEIFRRTKSKPTITYYNVDASIKVKSGIKGEPTFIKRLAKKLPQELLKEHIGIRGKALGLFIKAPKKLGFIKVKRLYRVTPTKGVYDYKVTLFRQGRTVTKGVVVSKIIKLKGGKISYGDFISKRFGKPSPKIRQTELTRGVISKGKEIKVFEIKKGIFKEIKAEKPLKVNIVFEGRQIIYKGKPTLLQRGFPKYMESYMGKKGTLFPPKRLETTLFIGGKKTSLTLPQKYSPKGVLKKGYPEIGVGVSSIITPTISEFYTFSGVKPESGIIPLIRVKSIEALKIKLELEDVTKPKLDIAFLPELKSRVDIRLKQPQSFKQVLIPKLKYKQLLQLNLKTSQKLEFAPLLPPRIINIKMPVIFPLLKTTQKKQVGDVPAFRVFVKIKGKRVFLSGKYPRGEAIKIGARRTRQTLRATFGIVEKGRVRVKRRVPSFIPSPEVFRTYRIVKGKRIPLKDVWIQKAPQRLKAKSEIKEILRVRKQKKKKGGRKMRWF